MMTTLAELLLPSTEGNRIKTAMLQSLKENDSVSARQHFQALLHYLPPQSRGVHFRQTITLNALAHALNKLEAEDKSRLFNKADLQITQNYLIIMARFSNTLEQLATTFQEMKYKRLLEARKNKGMQHFFQDLQDPRHNKLGMGWTMKNGLMTIMPSHFFHLQTRQEIHDYLGDDKRLGKKAWYEEPPRSLWESAIKQRYGIYVKTLGKNGENHAVDPIFILKTKSGSLKVLCGARRGGYALPGGMNETTVIETCISELLEECFSGAMFEKDSKTALELNNVNTFGGEIEECLIESLQKNLYTGKIPQETDINYSTLLTLHREKLEEAHSQAIQIVGQKGEEQNNSAFLLSVIERIKLSRLDEGQKPSIIAHLKCDLYKMKLMNEYDKFKTFILGRMHIEKPVINKSDPRNTDLAYMVTTPAEVVIDEEELTAYLKDECGLEYGAGDDLAQVQYRSIQTFLSDITNDKEGAYSDHASLVINAIRRGVERGEISVDNNLLRQLSSITHNNQGVNLGQDPGAFPLSTIESEWDSLENLINDYHCKSTCLCS